MSNYYTILGVNFSASSAEIKSKFKRLAIQYHPDKNPNNPEAEEKFKLVNEAYQTLSDPAKKTHYDALLLYAVTGHIEVSDEPEEVYVHPKDRGRTRRKSTPHHGPVKKVITPLNKTKTKQVLTFAGVTFVGFMVFCGWFYFFMERFTAESWTNQAYKAYEKEEYSRALSFLSDAFKKVGDIPETNYLKGAIEMHQYSNYQQGYRFINRAIKFSKEQEVTVPLLYYFDRGFAFFHLNKYDSATLDLEYVLSKNPKHHHAQVLRADIYLNEESNYQKAIQLYRLAAESDTFKHQATLGEAIAQHYQKNFKESEALLQLAYYQKPNSGTVTYYHALNILQAAKDTLQGCILLERASGQGARNALYQQSIYCRDDSTWFYQLYPKVALEETEDEEN